MYKKSLILLFTIFCVNSSFGGNNSTDSKLQDAPAIQFTPTTAIDNALLKALEKADPAQAALYLTLQQELNQNNMHERRGTPKPEMFFLTALASAAGGLFSAFFLKGEPQNVAGVASALALAGSLFCMAVTEKDTPYSDKNTEILKKMEAIKLEQRK